MPERFDKTDAIPTGAANPFAQFVDSKIPRRSYFESMREPTAPTFDSDMTQVIPTLRMGDVDQYSRLMPQGRVNPDLTEVIPAVHSDGLPWRLQEQPITKEATTSAEVSTRNNAQVEVPVLTGKIDHGRNFKRPVALALIAAAAVGFAGIKIAGSSGSGSANSAAAVVDANGIKLNPENFIAPALDCAKPGQLRTRISARAQSDILIPIDTKKDANSLTSPVGYPMFKDGVSGAPEGTVELNNVEICFDENTAAKKKNGTLEPFVTLAKNPKNKGKYVATVHRNLAMPVPKIPLGNCDTKDADGNAIVVCVDAPGATGLQISASTAKGIDANEAKAANEFVRSKDYSLIAISSMQNFTLKRLTDAPASATAEEKQAANVMRADIWKAFDAQLKNLVTPELAKYGVTDVTFAGDYASLEKDIYNQYKKSIDDPRVVVNPQITSLTITPETVG